MTFRRRTVLRGIGAAGATLAFAGYVSASGGRTQYIVITDTDGVDRRLEREGFEIRQELADGEVLIVHGPEDELEGLRGIAGVEAASRDVRFRLERPELEAVAEEDELEPPEFYEQFQWDKQVTESLEANEIATGDGTEIAVIDTGIELGHPDLEPNAEPGVLFRRVGGDPEYDDPDGLEDGEFEGETDVRIPEEPLDEDDQVTDADGNLVGYDPDAFEIVADRDASADVEGHGTHVAGIAAASDGGGVTGTAPDATVVSLRVFYWERDEVEFVPADDEAEVTRELVFTSTRTSDILMAIDRASVHGYDAANLSLGTPPLPPQVHAEGIRVAYERVIQRATQRGTVVVASAGNSEADLQRGGFFTVPNSTAGAMSVSATAPNDELAFYSNDGTNEIDVGAPGGGYETLEKTFIEDSDVVDWPFPTNLVFSTISPRVEGGSYGWKAGTSMAAPQVAGLAALVRDLESGANANRVESAIKAGAEEATGRSDVELGAGRVNARTTVETVAGEDDGPNRGNGNRGGGPN